MITLPANDPPDGPTPPHAPWNLVPAMHSGIRAKLAWLLARPVIARIDEEPELDPDEDSDEGSDVLREMALVGKGLVTEGPATRKQSAWREDRADGTCTVRICIDYDDLWRGAEKDIKDRVEATIESAVVFLTDAQKRLLEFSPREFIELNPRPANAELLAFETEIIGGSERVITLKVAEAPPSRQRQHLHHIAIVPNLVPLERQRDALTVIEAASDDGVLAPLRALVGLCSTDSMSTAPLENDSADEKLSGETPLDEYQRACIRKAMTTPHFAVIQGPPGSGKTTVITGVIRRALALGERVLVVSPTHVAVDNVVEKLLPREEAKAEPIDAHSLPVRFASRTKKLSEQAQDYWVGKNRQFRDATISGRVKQALQSAVPIAERLYAIEKNKVPGALSVALANRQNVICGTPIGILSYEPVKQAEPGAFDLLVVDEVSKLTLPEFLAVAVKARRWVLVGDPEQLPPYNAIEENGATLDDVLPPEIELACSVGAIIERTRPAARRDERIVVVASDPVRAVEIIAAHLRAVFLDDPLSVGLLDEPGRADIVVCTNNDLGRACTTLADRMVRILVERGLAAPRPDYASGARLVEATRRAPAQVFETSFNTYHALPWSRRRGQRLGLLGFRNGMNKYLPSEAAMAAHQGTPRDDASHERRALLDRIAERYAINAISVYDWLTGFPAQYFDVAPLCEIAALSNEALCDGVHPYVGTLKEQYRLHPSLSAVPRALFYDNMALQDGKPAQAPECRFMFLQVDRAKNLAGEDNSKEADTICERLEIIQESRAAKDTHASVMIITPYRRQEALLRDRIDAMRGVLPNLCSIEVCTLDRCQGREADYVFISLVRSRATDFMDMPKRWNVALTRAKDALFIVGDVDAYRRETTRVPRTPVSLIAHIIEAYDAHAATYRRKQA